MILLVLFKMRKNYELKMENFLNNFREKMKTFKNYFYEVTNL